MPIAKTHPSYNLFEAFFGIEDGNFKKGLGFDLSLDGEEISIKRGEEEVPAEEIYVVENAVRALIDNKFSEEEGLNGFVEDDDVAFFQAAKFAGIKIYDPKAITSSILFHATDSSSKEVCKFLVEEYPDLLFEMDYLGNTPGFYSRDPELRTYFSNKVREEFEKKPQNLPKTEFLNALAALETILTKEDSEEFKINGSSYQILRDGNGDLQLKAGNEIITDDLTHCNYAFYQLAQKIAFLGRRHTKESIELCFKYLGDRLTPDLERSLFGKVERDASSNEDAIRYLEDRIMAGQEILKPDQTDNLLRLFEARGQLSVEQKGYKITEEGIFLSVYVYDEDNIIWSKITDQKRISYALKEIAEKCIYEAAENGDVEMFKACREVVASADSGYLLALAKRGKSIDVIIPNEEDEEDEQRHEVSYELNPGHQEISKIISQEQQKSRDQFRDLARRARAAFISNIDGSDAEIELAIQREIDSFSGQNTGFNLNGLEARDMMSFMRDIRIIGPNKKANLDKSADSKTKEWIIPKKDDYFDGSLRAKLFYQQMMITCLEDDHRFISEEHNDRIRSLMRDRIVANYEGGLLFGEYTVVGLYQRAKIEELGYFEGLPRDISYKSLLSATQQGLSENRQDGLTWRGEEIELLKSQLDLLERPFYPEVISDFEKLYLNPSIKNLAFLEDDSPSDHATKELATLVLDRVIVEKRREWNLERQKDGRANLTEGEFQAQLKQFLDPNHIDEAYLREVLEFLHRENLEKVKETKKLLESLSRGIEDEESTRAEIADPKRRSEVVFNQIFGFDGLNPDGSMHVQKDEFSANPSLEAVFKVLRRGWYVAEPASLAEDTEDTEERQEDATTKIQDLFRGYRSRKEQLDLKELHKARKYLIDSDNLEVEESEYEPYYSASDHKAVDREYAKIGLISEIRGSRVEVSNTGLVIQEFEDGLDGLHKFSTQVDKSAERKLAKETDVEFSLSVIRGIPVRIDKDGNTTETKDQYCITTANNLGVTKTFVEDISEIEKRSQEIYKTNLDYLTLHDGLDIALKSLIKARADILPGGEHFINEDGEKIILSDKPYEEIEFSGYRKEMTQRIEGLRKCLSGLDPDENDSLQQRQDKARKLQKRFEDFEAGDAGKDFLSFMNGDLLTELIGEKRLGLVSGMLEHKASTEQQKTAARKHTAKSINHEVSDRVAASTYQNEMNLSFDGLEKAALTESYAKGRPWFERFNKAGFDSLMSVKMPHSPYPGVSISRPRGYGGVANATVAITFNIADDNFANDVAWIALKGCDKPYQMKVSVCDRDGDFYVYREGKKIKEHHKKGDIIIDTGVVFKRNAEGKHEAIEVSKIEPKSERFEVEQAIRDQRIKAVSVINGNRCSAALLYGGHCVGAKLEQRTAPIQEIDPGKPTKKRDEIESQDVIFRHDKTGKIFDLERKFAIISKEEGFNLVIPVKAFNVLHERNTASSIGFSTPELQFVTRKIDGDGKESFTTRQVELFSRGELSEDAQREFKAMDQGVFLKFASRFLSEEQLRIFIDNDGLDNPEQAKIFSSELKTYSEKTKVYVGYQEVEQDGTKGRADVLENTGPTQFVLYGKSGRISPSSIIKPRMAEPALDNWIKLKISPAVDDGAGTPDAKKTSITDAFSDISLPEMPEVKMPKVGLPKMPDITMPKVSLPKMPGVKLSNPFRSSRSTVVPEIEESEKDIRQRLGNNTVEASINSALSAAVSRITAGKAGDSGDRAENTKKKSRSVDLLPLGERQHLDLKTTQKPKAKYTKTYPEAELPTIREEEERESDGDIEESKKQKKWSLDGVNLPSLAGFLRKKKEQTVVPLDSDLATLADTSTRAKPKELRSRSSTTVIPTDVTDSEERDEQLSSTKRERDSSRLTSRIFGGSKVLPDRGPGGNSGGRY